MSKVNQVNKVKCKLFNVNYLRETNYDLLIRAFQKFRFDPVDPVNIVLVSKTYIGARSTGSTRSNTNFSM